jgi:sugar lactone lactonase YvrE
MEFAKVVPGGRTILPNGRFLTPLGERLYTGENLWNVCLSPDGRTVVGFAEEQAVVYRLDQTIRKPIVLARKDIAPVGRFSSDGKFLFLSLGDKGSLEVLNAESLQTVKTIETNVDGVTDAYLNDFLVSKDGSMVYAVDLANQMLVTVDVAAGRVIAREKAGRQPYAIAMSEDGKQLFVANIGLFDYSVIDPPKPGQGSERGLSRPPFGYPSKEAKDGIEMEGRFVPGLGDPWVPDSQSVWKYSVGTDSKPKLDRQAKSGILIHAPADGGKAVGGSAPNALLVRGNRLYVSNANNDTVQIFDTRTLKSVKTLKLTPSPLVAKLRGVIPSGMAMSPDGKRLYVCESGLNAVAVLDVDKLRWLGHLPVGWFPMQLAIAPDGKTLYVANHKGIGRGPRGSLNARKPGDERFGMPDMPGMISRFEVPQDMRELTKTVLANNGFTDLSAKRKTMPKGPMPLTPGKGSDQIKYVVFITKENHTFDGIFGELKERGARGEPEYAEFGTRGWIEEKGKDERLPIMPNHIRLANQFSISDNFYMEPQASGDGHRWLVGVYPSLWTSRVFYAGWNFKASRTAKARLTSFSSNGSQIPEDYLENGSMWEHLDQHGISFRNYGEGYEMPGSDEEFMTNRAGVYVSANWPMPKVLFDNTDFNFPTYNNNIPDIARADWFIEDLEKNFRSKGKPLPRFINIAICNDHGAAPNPKQGFPYVCSYMADNDLALGRIVEWLSHQPEWKNMAIFVTQDDPGADNDHIDRHRSFVLAISPYAKRGYITREHTSIMSIIKSIYLLFGLGPNNQFDAAATSLHDMFTDKPDFTPYKHVDVDRRVFRPEETFDPTDPEFKRRRAAPSVGMDDPKFVDWLRKRSRGQN